MKISELIKCDTALSDKNLKGSEKEYKLTDKIDKIDEDTIYFHLRRVGEKEYKLPKYSGCKPYLTICEDEIENVGPHDNIITVPDVRKTLAYAYSSENKVDYSKVKIIGITGTNGKSSTSEIITKILRESGNSVGYIGTGQIRINDKIISDSYYSMTTPDPEILYKSIAEMIETGCNYIVMEVSSHALALSKVAPIKFECGIFTNLSSEHMDFHTDMEDYFITKMKLFENCKIGFFNIDDRYGMRAYHSVKIKKYSIGILTPADAYITDLNCKVTNGNSFFYRESNLIFKISTKLSGHFNIYNVLISAKCAIALGIKPCIVKKAIEGIENIRGRYECVEGPPHIIIDYAHTPFALENVLKSINVNKNSRQSLILVFGCGGNRDKEKRHIMGRCAEKAADKVIITEDNSRSENFHFIKEDILSGFEFPESPTVIESRSDAIRYAILNAKDDDIVAIIGKGDERYLIDNMGYHSYSEKEVILNALRERNMDYENRAGV